METLIQQLKVILGTNFHFYQKIQCFHWNVEGMDFVQYHTFLGDLYKSVYSNHDIIAEKIRFLKAYAPTGLDRLYELSDIEDVSAIPDARAMFSILEKDNERLMFHFRAGIAAAEQADEPAISNFLQDLLDQHAKHGWFLRSINR